MGGLLHPSEEIQATTEDKASVAEKH
uniref:Uncharacterized protein n=1 Tax=Anguilla anguilla TaxID=7936 RepID=A0A0E9UNY2_ANGAN